MFRKPAVMLLALTMTCSAAMLAGCANNTASNGNADTAPRQTIYSPKIPENRVDDSAPGTDITAALGEDVSYESKVDVKLDQVIEIDDVDKSKRRVLLAELTITNKSDAEIDCSTLSHFDLTIDGVTNAEPIRDVVAAIVARKYYTQIGSDLQNFNSPIKPGETLKGYVYIGAPTKWDSMQLTYIPYRYYNNDHIIFDIAESDLQHYTGDLP